MQNFMKDRYGVDDLSSALGAVGIVLALIGVLFNAQQVSWIAILVLVLALVRAFSKNFAMRRSENDAFRRIMARIPVVGKRFGGSSSSSTYGRRAPNGSSAAQSNIKRQARTAKKMWKERKTKAFLKCPTCGTMLSVPKGKGKIIVTCPKCRTRMESKS